MSKLARGRSGWLVTLLLMVGAAILIAGCGGGSSSSSSSASETDGTGTKTTAAQTQSGGSDNPAVKKAETEFAKFVKPQPPIEIPPLSKKPPTGKKITILTCPLPVCQSETKPAKEAAEALGWKVTYLQTELTPEAYQAAMNQIVADPPELLSAITSIPYELIEKQIKDLAAKNIPIVLISPLGVEPSPAGPVKGIVVGPDQFAQSGRLMGAAVVNEAGEGAKTVFITDPSLGVWNPAQAAFSKVVTEAGGEAEVLKVEAAQIGKNIPTQVTSYVQSHPEVEYLAFALSDLSAGVPQALESAGLNEQVKIVSRAPQAVNLENIENGTEWATVAEENTAGGWRSVDQLARLLEGEELGELANPAGWAQILTAESITETDAVPTTPGVPQVFEEAWHLK
jgi:ribose transport system substrate-binding protein